MSDIFDNIAESYRKLVFLVGKSDFLHKIIGSIIGDGRKNGTYILETEYRLTKFEQDFVLYIIDRAFRMLQRGYTPEFKDSNIESYEDIDQYLTYHVCTVINMYFSEHKNWSGNMRVEEEEHRHLVCDKSKVISNLNKFKCFQIKHKHRHITGNKTMK